MFQDSAKSPYLPQFDAPDSASEEPLRVVLLGASNLALTFPTIIETARRAFRRPLELHVAMGFGRSYGQDSGFLGKKFSGILRSPIWDALARQSHRETIALVADVGNDLGYGTPPERLLEWICEALDRLAQVGARTAVNNVPLPSIESLGAMRYRVMKSILFPSCTLSRDELVARVRALSEALGLEAAKRKTPVFSGEKSWYGVDPIHPRRRHAGEVWRRMLGAASFGDAPVPVVRPRWRQSVRLRRLQPVTADFQGEIPADEMLLDGDAQVTKFFMY